jgi:transcriptional regulator with XRE-family HTH domain
VVQRGKARGNVHRRMLGVALRNLRTAAGLKQDDVAVVIGVDRATVSRYETGQTAPGRNQLEDLLTSYNVAQPERDNLIELGKLAERPQTGRAYADALPNHFQRFADVQADARVIRSYEPAVILGLLQTEDYARALIREGMTVVFGASPSEIDTLITYRMERQEILRRPDPPLIHFLMGEAALHQQIGSRDITRRQLLHLVDAVDNSENIVMQVLPLRFPASAYISGAFVWWTFPEPAPEIACVLATTTNIYTERPDDIEGVKRVFEALQAAALSPDESRQLITQIARDT